MNQLLKGLLNDTQIGKKVRDNVDYINSTECNNHIDKYIQNLFDNKCETQINEKLCKSSCVKPGMGGHEGAFINYVNIKNNKCNVNCGKKYIGDSITECRFYIKLGILGYINSIPKSYLKYIPKFHGLFCSTGNSKYFVMDNITSNVGKNDKNLDFKLGHKTAFKHESGLIKTSIRHKQISSRFSISNQYGFRLEGSTEKLKLIKAANNTDYINNELALKYVNEHKLSHILVKHLTEKITLESLTNYIKNTKFNLYIIHPLTIFSKFFEDKRGANLSKAKKTMMELYNMFSEFYYPNWQNSLRLLSGSQNNDISVGFIGSSLMLVYGSKGVNCKLIDLAHPIVMTKLNTKKDKENNYKIVSNMTSGFVNLLILLDYWIYTHEPTWVNNNKEQRKLLHDTYTYFELYVRKVLKMD